MKTDLYYSPIERLAKHLRVDLLVLRERGWLNIREWDWGWEHEKTPPRWSGLRLFLGPWEVMIGLQLLPRSSHCEPLIVTTDVAETWELER